MPKEHYFLKLIAPRSSFVADITDAERLLMEEHARYTQERFDAGDVLLFGPVLATDGAFGVAILEVVDETAARRFGNGDPAVRAGLMTFELHRMRVADAHAKRE